VSELLVWFAVGALGGLGALARFLVAERLRGDLPWGILAVNLSGAFALGALSGAGVSGTARLLAATAAIGAYTTFSTWMLESRALAREGRRAAAALNVAGSLVLGFAAVAAGRWLASG